MKRNLLIVTRAPTGVIIHKNLVRPATMAVDLAG
jgi:hypothetical protein